MAEGTGVLIIGDTSGGELGSTTLELLAAGKAVERVITIGGEVAKLRIYPQEDTFVQTGTGLKDDRA